MIVVAILEGYFASSRNRTIVDVFRETKEKLGLPPLVSVIEMGMKSSILRSKSRQMRRFIIQHASAKSSLICIGKSYGAKQIINKVINKISDDVWENYRSTFLITVDPCWPTLFNWTPNLNRRSLYVNKEFTRSRNIYLRAPKHIQAGCKVYTKYSTFHSNVEVYQPITHNSIIESYKVKKEIILFLRKASNKFYQF